MEGAPGRHANGAAGELHVHVAHECAASAALVLEIAGDPGTYPEWVGTLQSLEGAGGSRYLARAGYLSYSRSFAARRLAGPPGTVVWEARDGALRLRLSLTVRPIEPGRALLELAGGTRGGNPLAELGISAEIARLLLRSVAHHSLVRLARRAAAQAQPAWPKRPAAPAVAWADRPPARSHAAC